jgi:hypothetical protein
VIARLICYFTGHRRGKFHSLIRDADNKVTARMYICPRCTATWTRKAKG